MKRNSLISFITVLAMVVTFAGISANFAPAHAAEPVPTVVSKYFGTQKSIDIKGKLTLEFQNTDGSAVTWKSSKTSVATVSSTGVVTGKKKGSATITATNASGQKATYAVSVKQLKPSKISLEKGIKALPTDPETGVPVVYTSVTQKIRFIPEYVYDNGMTYTLSTADKKYAKLKTTKVTKSQTIAGLVAEMDAQGIDSQYIKVKFKAKEVTSIKGDQEFIVKRSCKNIYFKSVPFMEVGQTKGLTVCTEPFNTNIATTCTSSDENVIKVEETATPNKFRITAVGNGEAIITAVTAEGYPRQTSVAIQVGNEYTIDGSTSAAEITVTDDTTVSVQATKGSESFDIDLTKDDIKNLTCDGGSWGMDWTDVNTVKSGLLNAAVNFDVNGVYGLKKAAGSDCITIKAENKTPVNVYVCLEEGDAKYSIREDGANYSVILYRDPLYMEAYDAASIVYDAATGILTASYNGNAVTASKADATTNLTAVRSNGDSFSMSLTKTGEDTYAISTSDTNQYNIKVVTY